jgi:hypothetical protein
MLRVCGIEGGLRATVVEGHTHAGEHPACMSMSRVCVEAMHMCVSVVGEDMHESNIEVKVRSRQRRQSSNHLPNRDIVWVQA